ncbi:type IV pilin [Natrinema salaciae]|uniref:Archaeal Type IV pilin N-terminal domain-containing protein n=1 Tax=Natrinema salaciae TaxID=1186196 RepID=A0A1H9S1U3_9EURY|nr:Protein of unknown function [Natrinema salaciae]
MVAITVILAAVIAAFVLDMTPGGDTVQASVDVSASGTDTVELSVNDGGNADYLVLVEAGSGSVANADGGTPTGTTEEANTGASYTVHSVTGSNDNDDFLSGAGQFTDTDYEVWAVDTDLSGGDSLDAADASVKVGEFTLT